MSRAANSIVGAGVWPKFKLVQYFMVVPVAWKNENEP